MTNSEVSGHALSVIALVAGGLVFKSIVLNWIVGPVLVVAIAVASARAASFIGQRQDGT